MGAALWANNIFCTPSYCHFPSPWQHCVSPNLKPTERQAFSSAIKPHATNAAVLSVQHLLQKQQF